MKLTVKAKVITGLTAIVLIGLFAKLFMYRQLDIVGRDVQRLAHVDEPLILAAYEMEINMNGIGLAVLKYISTRNPRYRKWALKDIDDFAEFHEAYLKLVASSEERALDAKLTLLYREFEVLAKRLMQRADDQEALFQQASASIERIDELLDKELQPGFDSEEEMSRTQMVKAIARANLEAEIAEVGFWTANYQRLHNPKFKAEIDEKLGYFDTALQTFEGYLLTEQEDQIAKSVRALFGQIKAEIAEVVALQDRIYVERDNFIALRSGIDDMLDDEIQPLARQHLIAPIRDADAATDDATQAMRILIPVYVIIALIVGIYLIRSVIAPLNKLRDGTMAIRTGNLQHRIAMGGQDEFAELARDFDNMVSRLQATTVSKESLEDSERQLKATVMHLRNEIVEREHAQAAQAKLQAALRRSERMSAMGALVAGVAHEVRNPLFGISATLDAMEVRFAGHADHQRYDAVLRGEVDRIRKLMANLLEYGKPSASEMVPESVGALIAQAAELCAPVATGTDVGIVQHIESDLPAMYIDRTRLLQVFRNLLENAIQHSPRASEVRISAKRAGEGLVCCVVEDSGPGFREEDVAIVFEPFFTRRRGGTGLGLSIVSRIVDDHGGKVSASNRDEGGASVTVCLPCARRSPEQTGVTDSELLAKPNEGGAFGEIQDPDR